jgi:hypothetical protein
MGTGGSFPGSKARPGRDADHSPPSSAEVKKEHELYLLSPKGASMERNGSTLPFFYLYLSTNSGNILETVEMAVFCLASPIYGDSTYLGNVGTSTRLDGAVSQKAVIFIHRAVRTWSLTF